jgi:cytochrome d ubiquinol oxidase subunit II
VAFGSITSTLSVPLFIAAVGIILRGAAYALRGQLEEARGQRMIENLFALSSVLTPFALGTVVGGIASSRVPVGNAAGNLMTSWLNPTSIFIGLLAVVTGGYLAAVYLAADAHRLGEELLEHDFRARALISGVVAGALAITGLFIVHADAPALSHGLMRGGGLAMVVLSGLAGLATLVMVWRSQFGPARISAALAVTAIIAGWALAQRPQFLPGLTVSQAAAGRSTLIAVLVAVAGGAIVLIPSLILLFRLFLLGHLGATEGPDRQVTAVPTPSPEPDRRTLAVVAVIALLVGAALTVLAPTGWLLALGVVCLVACAVATFGLSVSSDDGH